LSGRDGLGRREGVRDRLIVMHFVEVVCLEH
jgi:hypothetical protein